jgi:predicted transcriptional regulator
LPSAREINVSENDPGLITLTADIVAAHVSNNSVPTAEIANLIHSVYSALQAIGNPAPEPQVEKPKGAVSARASIKPDFLISMIDGKPYKMLRRHISQQGYTPESYRETFGLPHDYPMVASSYAEQRRALAHKIGLGRKPETPTTTPAPAPKRSRRSRSSED